MSERFYRQQMAHFNIKSVHELGQFHRGEITKTGKRPVVTTPDGTVKRVLKSDIVVLINAYFTEEVKELEKLRMEDLNDLLAALAYFKEDYVPALECIDQGRFKKDTIKEIKSILCLPETYTLDLTRLTVGTLKQLQTQLCKGVNYA